MSKQNPLNDFFSHNDFSKLFENFKSLPFDMQSALETQRKNIQAFSEAQQIAVENFQAIAQRQSQIISQLVEDNSKIAKELMAEGTPEEKIAKNADIFKALYERSVKNMNELNEMLSTSNQEASKIINKRVSASITEIKSSLEKTSQLKKAA
jgi:phasin family protein